MNLLWKYLADMFVEELKTQGSVNAALRLAGTVGVLWFRRQHRELFELDVYRNYIATSENRDALFHLSHRHYLSTRIGYRQRVECALTHYRYEGQHYDDRYKNAVYRDDGLVLWSRSVDGIDYSIRLRSTQDPRHEGGTSIVLQADDIRLSEMSFVWVDGTLLGAPAGILPLITKNQSVKFDAAALHRFREAFPQNSPSYFCFAAMHGIATAHGHRRIAGIKHDCQIAFDDRFAQSFRNSYTDFWKSFGGTESNGQAYLMPVPLTPPPLSEVKAKHRKRALARRRQWTDIAESAAETTSRHRRAIANPPRHLAPQLFAFIAPHVSTVMSLALAV